MPGTNPHCALPRSESPPKILIRESACGSRAGAVIFYFTGIIIIPVYAISVSADPDISGCIFRNKCDVVKGRLVYLRQRRSTQLARLQGIIPMPVKNAFFPIHCV